MKKRAKIASLFGRYAIMLIIGYFIGIFYTVFKPLTIYPVYFLLDIIYNISLSGSIISIGTLEIEMINACIAGSAYFLLLALNFSIPNTKPKKRIYALLLGFSMLLAFNILRVFILSILLINDFVYFEAIHMIFWYAFSIAAVVLIWILTAKIFRIKGIPFISDFIYLKKFLIGKS